MSKEKNPTQRFEFLTSGVVKENADDKGPKIQVNHCKGPGVVRNRVASKKVSINKQIKEDAEYGLGPGVVKGNGK